MIPLAHIAGTPVEETIASLGPALLLTLGAASATPRSLAPGALIHQARCPTPKTGPRSARTARQIEIEAARPQPGPAAKRHNIRPAHSRREGAGPATPARPLPHCAREAGASEAAPPLSQRTTSISQSGPAADGSFAGRMQNSPLGPPPLQAR